MNLYEDHTKIAFLGAMMRAGRAAAPAVARAAAPAAQRPGLLRSGLSTAYNFGKGVLFMDPSAKATGGQRLANGAGKVFAFGSPMLANAGVRDTANSSVAVGPWPVGGAKTAAAQRFEMRLYKLAFGSVTDGIDAAAYAAFLASKFTPEHHWAHTALDATGLALLGGTTAYDIARGNHRKAAVKDLIGLALMGSALRDRHGTHG